MNNFLNKYFNKDILERIALVISIVGALSIFFGAVFQYSALSYGELSFFSWTQTINDGMKILPITISIFLFGFVGYGILLFLSNTKQYIKHPIFSYILLICILFACLYGLKFSQEHYPNFFVDNLYGAIFIGIMSLLVVMIYIMFLYLIFFFFKKQEFSIWIKKNKVFVIIFVLFLAMWNTMSTLKYSLEFIDRTNCFLHEGRIFKLKYMNDKYIFTDIHPKTNDPNDKRYYTDVFENKDTDFILRFQSCEEVDKNFTHYIKKGGKCVEVLSFDNDYQYFNTSMGLIKNNGYDIYLSGYCIPDKQITKLPLK